MGNYLRKQCKHIENMLEKMFFFSPNASLNIPDAEYDIIYDDIQYM